MVTATVMIEAMSQAAVCLCHMILSLYSIMFAFTVQVAQSQQTAHQKKHDNLRFVLPGKLQFPQNDIDYYYLVG